MPFNESGTDFQFDPMMEVMLDKKINNAINEKFSKTLHDERWVRRWLNTYGINWLKDQAESLPVTYEWACSFGRSIYRAAFRIIQQYERGVENIALTSEDHEFWVKLDDQYDSPEYDDDVDID